MTNSGEKYLDFKGEINDNEFICLVGYSGCGKTTLLRMLAGLTNPDEGCIKYGDDYWYEHSSKYNLAPQNRHIAYMFQDFALFPNMTVYQNIVFAQSEKNHDKIMELINIFGLSVSITISISNPYYYDYYAAAAAAAADDDDDDYYYYY